MSDSKGIYGITLLKAKLYKTAQFKETGEFVAIKAAGFYAFNAVTGREEFVFNVYGNTTPDPATRFLRGQFYQSALMNFVL